MINFFFWTMMALLALLAWRLISNYNKSVKEYNRQLRVNAYTNYMERVYESSRRQMQVHSSTVRPVEKDQWAFYPIEERKTQL